MDLWQPGKRWLKGNLHAHTTASDGRISIEECIKRYKEHGYDFLAITDHRKRFAGYQDDEILVIPAKERYRVGSSGKQSKNHCFPILDGVLEIF